MIRRSLLTLAAASLVLAGVLALAGCDRLTISPDLLAALEQSDTPVARALVDGGERVVEPAVMVADRVRRINVEGRAVLFGKYLSYLTCTRQKGCPAGSRKTRKASGDG